MSLRFDSSLPPTAPLAPPVRQMPVETVTAPTAPPAPPQAEAPPAAPPSTATTGNYASGFDPAGQTQFRGQTGAVLTRPAAGVSDRVLDKSYLFRALSRAMDRFPGSPPPLLISGAAPVLSGIRAGASPSPALPGAPAQLEDVDTRNLASFSTVLASIDAQAKAGQLDPARRGSEIVAQALELIDPEHKLNETMRKGLGEFLAKLPPESLAQAEVQGAGGASAGHGVTGSGAAGQYVNSVMSSLQQLTNAGRLDGKLLASLSLLTDAGRLDAKLRSQQGELIRSVLQDVAFPDKINQHSKATCAPTTVQIIFATRKPAEYVALVANLASSAGKGLPEDPTSDSEETIVREPGTEVDDKSGRSLSNRLVQPAFIEYANGKGNDYNNATDKDSKGNSGLHINGTARLMQKLMPDEDHRAAMFNPNLSEGIDAVKELTDKGHLVTAGLSWGNDAHQVLVTKIDTQNKLAYFMNPWGELQTMGLDEFQKRLASAVVPGKVGNSGPVMGTIPGAAARSENYKPIDAARYLSAAEYLEKEPVLKDFFSADQRREIGYGLVVFKVPPSTLDALANAVKALGLPKSFATELVGRIKGTSSADELNKLLRVVNFAQYAIKKETITPAQMNALLEAHPERNLPTEKFEAMLTALNTGSAEKSLGLASEALARQLAVTPPEQQAALVARVLASPHDSAANQAAAALKLAVYPEKTLAGEELAKAVNALAFGSPDPQEMPALMAKAIGGSDLDAAQVKSLIQGYLKSNDSEFAGNLLKAVRSEPRLAPVVTAFAKDLAHGVPKDTDVNFAKALRQCLNGPETAKVAASLDKFLKGFHQHASYEPPQVAASAAPAATASAPDREAPAEENPQAATDKALAARLPALIAKAGQKPEAQRPAELARLVLAELDPGKKLKSPALEAVLRLLEKLPADAGLAAAEVQGAGGMDKGAGVTGSGKDGHYVNGMMTSLQQLIRSDRMTAELAQSLSALGAVDNLAPELKSQRDALLRSTLQDVAFPESINQHSKGTCAPTTTQIMLAVKNPTQYVDIMRGLASKDGQATGVEAHEDANDNITRKQGTDQDDKSGRSLSGRLMQVALMEYGNGKDVTYDNETDKHKDSKPAVPGKEDKGGLGNEGVHRILTKLFPGEAYARLQHPPDDKDRLLQSIQQQVAKGHPVTVGMPWDDSAHQVLVTGLDEQKKLAYLMNPWGELQTMPLDEFKEKVSSAVFPTKGDRGKPALELLPNSAGKPESYKPLDPDRYYTATDILRKDPQLQGFFSADQAKALAVAYQKLSLPLDSLRYLSAAIKKGKPPLEPQEIVRAIANSPAKDQAHRFVRMLAFATAGNENSVGNFDSDQFKNAWAALGKSNQTAPFEQALEALTDKDTTKVRDLMATRYAQNFEHQALEDRGPYLQTIGVAKDDDSQALAQLILRAQPEKSLSPAEMGQLAAGLAMRDFNGKPAEALGKLLSAQATRWSAAEAGASIKALIHGSEAELAGKLLDQVKRQGHPPIAELAVNLAKSLDMGYLTSLSRSMLETLRDNIKGSQDPALQQALVQIENQIKNMF